MTVNKDNEFDLDIARELVQKWHNDEIEEVCVANWTTEVICRLKEEGLITREFMEYHRDDQTPAGQLFAILQDGVTTQETPFDD